MRCKDCPESDEEAKVIAEAFGLPEYVMVSGSGVHLTMLHGQPNTVLLEFETAMWHALVRSYRTLLQYYPANYYRPGEPEPR